MRRRLLSVAVAAVAGLIAIPFPASADLICPSGALCIDESIEGAPPTVIGGTGVVTPLATSVGEAWHISITGTGTSFTSITQAVGLREPNSQSLSDALVNASLITNFVNGVITFALQYDLFSDNELGQIGNACSGCTFLTEDGTFQNTNNVAAGHSVFLKSDLEAVPEPASGAVLAAALGGFWLVRRRRAIK
jgi:hypothetical protein